MATRQKHTTAATNTKDANFHCCCCW